MITTVKCECGLNVPINPPQINADLQLICDHQAEEIERLRAEMDGMKSLLDASLRGGVAGKAIADRDEAREIAVNLYRFLSHHEAVPEICDDYKWLIDAVTAEGDR